MGRDTENAKTMEGSPLLSPVRSASPYGIDRTASGSPFEMTVNESRDEEEHSVSMLYLFALALGIGGVQIAWGVETSKGSEYLQGLGMSKALLALVWIAGPLGGVLVQPYIGIRSDNCRISWGKRRPFMVFGAVATSVSFMALAWAREIVHGLLGLFGADPESKGVVICTMVWATICVYVLDFAINAGEVFFSSLFQPILTSHTVQAAIRAFIVDNAPTHQQSNANAWASILCGVGSILTYFAGAADLPKVLGWLGHTQMQVLSAIGSLAICGTTAISCISIRERDPRLEGNPVSKGNGLIAFFREIFASIVRLPPQVRKVCIGQLFNWMGWFGFLFYQTNYIGQIYCNPYFEAHPDLTPAEIDEKWEEAIRVATGIMLIYAITTLISSVVFPILVASSPHSDSMDYRDSNNDLSASHTSFTLHPKRKTWRNRMTNLLEFVGIPGFTLRRAWLLSHFLFAICMFSTLFITTMTAVTIQTALVGVAWAITQWAPFALIAAEISRRDAEARQQKFQSGDTTQHDQAGVILGLHNVAISAPQIAATIVGSAIFRAAEKPRGTPWDDSLAWMMQFGGLVALLAAFFTWKVDEEQSVGGKSRKGSTFSGGSGRYERVGTNGSREEFRDD